MFQLRFVLVSNDLLELIADGHGRFTSSDNWNGFAKFLWVLFQRKLQYCVSLTICCLENVRNVTSMDVRCYWIQNKHFKGCDKDAGMAGVRPAVVSTRTRYLGRISVNLSGHSRDYRTQTTNICWLRTDEIVPANVHDTLAKFFFFCK